MIRDRDKAYGNEFSRRVRDLGIRAIKTAIRAPKMNCYAERLIGTIRRELFDHVIVSSERHARRLLQEFQVWYNEDRLHLALEKDAPDHRPVEPPEMGEVISLARLGGLHHRYSRGVQPEAKARLRRHPELSAMPSDSVRLPAARLSVTETTERRRAQNPRPTSLAHHNSVVDSGPVPSLASASILTIHTGILAGRGPFMRSSPGARMGHNSHCGPTGAISPGGAWRRRDRRSYIRRGGIGP